MPPNPERQARLRAKREEMANDPKLREAMEDASQAVLGRSGGGGSDEVPENLASGAPSVSLEGETEADKEKKSVSSFGRAPTVAPPLSKPPMGPPTVPVETPRTAPRMAMPRGGGSAQRLMTAAPADTAQVAPLTITPNPRIDPLGVGPNWKYATGGVVRSPSFAKGGGANYGTDYRKRK